MDVIKINLDASFHATTKSGGWGVIARGNDGGILMAAAGPLANLQDALQAEALALLKAIELADRLGMGRVIF